ncbi:TIGR01244 family sulfur transferase [Vibrio ulleungensis]|jgi:sulfide:quinone oxidoreductase|uniref:TIGR01244 family phosphatase n=1 Tax=Vibrio ulleungensis TaxID=2807619 RepID=A0ABS2HDS7_9VIBR|nr:TIGR01244 family sulfur transferase [Vibrio ulleungensis]MBM7035164.1 TIGR01244 family phosphatase [Vibrio ulleungensis]
MNITKLAENYSVSPQIAVQDIATIKEMGFDGIVCNRPNGEEPGQPLFDELMLEAANQGIDIVAIPMNGPEVTMPMVEQFNQFMQQHQRVFAFCRTGNRSSIIWKAALAVN